VNEVSVTFESHGRSVTALDRISLRAHAGAARVAGADARLAGGRRKAV